MSTKKAVLSKCSNIALSIMAVMAIIFVNCQCSGRAHEPELLKELR